MSANNKLSNAIQAIEDAEKVLKRIKNDTQDADLQHQIRRSMRELDEAKQYIESARRDVRDI